VAFATGAAVRGIISQYTEFERYRTVLTTFLGSQQAANAELRRLGQLANALPQDLADVTQAFTVLSRFGIDTTNQSLTAFSNIATANAKSMTQLAEAVADAMTGEFERLKEFGIKVSKENGKFVARIGDDQVAVAKTSRELVQQLQQLGNTRFAGAAAANADTLDQSFSNLRGTVFEASVAFGEALKPALKDAVGIMTDLIGKNHDLARSLGTGVGEAIRGTAHAIKFLADNFALIRDVAISALFIQGAASAVNFLKAINQLRGGSADLAVVASKVPQALGQSIAKIPVLGGMVSGLVGTLARLGPALLNPWIGIPVAIGAAALALMRFSDSTVQLGQTSATLGETFSAAVGIITDEALNLGRSIWDSVSGVFSDIGAVIGVSLGDVADALATLARYTVKVMAVVYEGTVGLWSQLPRFFWQILKSAGTIISSFGSAVGDQFREIWDYIASGGQDSIQNSFSKFTEIARAELANMQQSIPRVDFAAAWNLEAFDQIKRRLEERVLKNRQLAESENQVEQALDGVSRAMAAQSGAAGELEGYAKFLADLSKSATDAYTKTAYTQQAIQDLTLAFQAGSEPLELYRLKMHELGVETSATGEILTASAKFYQDLMKSTQEAVDQATYATEAQQLLAEAYSRGEITLAVFNEAMERTNQILGINTERTKENRYAVTDWADILKHGTNELERSRRQALENTIAMGHYEQELRSGAISMDEFRERVKASGLDLADVTDQTIKLGLTISDSMREAGDSLAKNLAQGLAQGKLSLSSFSDFFNQILDDILTAIIQKNITQPLVDQLLSGLSGAGGASGGGLLNGLGSLLGGSGGTTGGGLGDFFGNVWSGITSFFGGFFADGGNLGAGKWGIAGESGPEIIRGPANIQPVNSLNTGSAAESPAPLTVNFNINAIDTRTGTEFLLQNKPQIIGMVTQAYNKQGRRGVIA
jgi:hypothetical protein